jgi:hypothetical protein
MASFYCFHSPVYLICNVLSSPVFGDLFKILDRVRYLVTYLEYWTVGIHTRLSQSNIWHNGSFSAYIHNLIALSSISIIIIISIVIIIISSSSSIGALALSIAGGNPVYRKHAPIHTLTRIHMHTSRHMNEITFYTIQHVQLNLTHLGTQLGTQLNSTQPNSTHQLRITTRID